MAANKPKRSRTLTKRTTTTSTAIISSPSKFIVNMSDQSQAAHGQRREARRAAQLGRPFKSTQEPCISGTDEGAPQVREGGREGRSVWNREEGGGRWSGKDRDGGVWWESGGKGKGRGGVDLSIVTKRTRNDAGRETVPIHRLHQRHISVPATAATSLCTNISWWTSGNMVVPYATLSSWLEQRGHLTSE